MTFSGNIRIKAEQHLTQIEGNMTELVVAGNESKELDALMRAARIAIGDIITSGALGSSDSYDFLVNVSGNVTPNNEILAAGTSNCLYIAIIQEPILTDAALTGFRGDNPVVSRSTPSIFPTKNPDGTICAG